MNGFRGEKLIERLGLGVDGYAADRLAQQQARDAGKLGGVWNMLYFHQFGNVRALLCRSQVLALQPSEQI